MGRVLSSASAAARILWWFSPLLDSLPKLQMMTQGWLRSRTTMRRIRSTTAAVHSGSLPGTFFSRTPWLSTLHSSITYSPSRSQRV